jgi:hypothetical protein
MNYDPIISEASRRFGVPQERIRAVMSVESGGQPWARSPKGAAGLMQVMPDTYTELAKRHNLGPDRFNPQNNIMAGTAYLGEMYDQFGNWGEATQAYNMGPGRAMKVRNGTATMPAETVAYMPKVNAALGNQTQEAGVPLFSGQRAATDDDTARWTQAAMPGGLLDFGPDKNFYDGLGLLNNTGQTPSQPPRIDPQAMPGSTQTDRLDVGGRINELLQQYMQQPQQRSSVSPLQYALGGASAALQPLAGVHDRQVGLGEMLGALGGGMFRGSLAGDEAQRADRANQIGELGTLGKIQQYQRGEATADRQLAAAAAFADRLDQAGQKDLAAAVRGNPSLMDEVVKAMAASQYPKDGTGNFALSPGQTQFDRFGKPIASVTDRPQTTTLSPGQSLVEQGTGKPIATAGGGTTQLTAAEVAAAGLPAGTVAQRKADGSIDVVSKPDGTPFDQATKLRAEFTTAAKPLIEMRQMYGRVDAAYKDTTPVGDIALTYGFMKMLDPTSVVREGEYATAQNAAGVPDRIRQQWNALVDGNRLSPGVRGDMYKQAQAQFGVIEKQHSELEGRYRELATRQGLDPANVVIDLRGGVKMEDGAKAPDPNNPPPPRAVNPQTGETKEWNGSAWVTVK